MIHDVAGIGFGPANLALAIAIAEQSQGFPDPVSAVFLERQPRFGWHRGMLIEDATMQVSFVKDLVTLRNPSSEYSFLCYLHSKGRLVDFVNHKSLFPLRVEFHDYLEWAAAKVDHMVHYGQEVVDIVPVMDGDRVGHFEVVAQGPERTRVFLARNLVLATGLIPALPEGVLAGERIWHSGDLLTNVGALDGVAAERFVVVGAGQSAAEVTAYLHERFPRAQVRAVFSRYGYSPSDDSPFANRIFDPGAVDDFFDAPQDVKQLMLGYHANTNYSVVDIDLINELYRRAYREKVLGAQRLHLHNVSRLIEASEHAGGVVATVESLLSGEKLMLEADVLVCATGYRPADPSTLLGAFAGSLRRDELGRLRVDRDYRVQTRQGLDCGIYLQGGTEHTHGITSSLLSNTAIRAGEILRSVTTRR